MTLVVWAHKSNDTNWDHDSYFRLHEVETVKEFWGSVRVMNDFLGEMMFFVMVEDGVPRWEHEDNKLGGYWSVRVDGKHVQQVFENILCKVATGTLIRDVGADLDTEIVGVSTSMKGKFGILKIWMKTCDLKDPHAIAIDGPARNTLRFTQHLGKDLGGKVGAVVH